MNRRRSQRREPTIALVNIVFLMLIFFLVAGQVAQPVDGALRLVKTDRLDPVAPPDPLVIHADGSLSHRGTDIPGIGAYLERQSVPETVRVMPDRDLPAAALVLIGRALTAAGVGQVIVVAEQGTP